MKEIVRFLMRPPLMALHQLGFVPPEKVFRHFYTVGPIEIQLPGGRGTLKLMSWGDRVENEFFWRGWIGHEPEVMRWWCRLSLDSTTILDVGANTGTFSFMSKALNPEATVHAFEPVARISDRIRKNVEVSGLDVMVFQQAVSNTNGEALIHDPGGENAYSASLSSTFLQGEKTSYVVPTVTVDKHCEDLQISPDLLKIDVEGLEAQAILGAEKLLTTRQPVLICEWLGDSQDHLSASSMLDDLGYVAMDPRTLKRVELSHTLSHHERNVMIGTVERLGEVIKLGPIG